MPPIGDLHAWGTQRSRKWAGSRLLARFELRVQLPFETPGASIPKPDVGILSDADSRRKLCPNRAELAIEVVDSSRRLDLQKAMEYASDVREYRILDVVKRTLTVFRNSHPDATALHGFAYDPPMTLAETETATPLCEPMASILVKELLP